MQPPPVLVVSARTDSQAGPSPAARQHADPAVFVLHLVWLPWAFQCRSRPLMMQLTNRPSMIASKLERRPFFFFQKTAVLSKTLSQKRGF